MSQGISSRFSSLSNDRLHDRIGFRRDWRACVVATPLLKIALGDSTVSLSDVKRRHLIHDATSLLGRHTEYFRYLGSGVELAHESVPS